MKLEKINIEELKPATYNPRKKLKPSDKEYQKVKRSIEEFGYVDPIIANKDLTIIGGHQRMNVMKDMGFKEVDVVIIDVDKNKEKALNVALNKITGEWDYGKLGDLLLELDAENYDLAITGFENFEIESIMAPIDWAEVEDLDEKTYDEPTHKMLECPSCHHIDRDIHFKKIQATDEEINKLEEE